MSRMKIFTRRGIQRNDIFLVYSACAFSVFAWSLISLFYQLPPLMLRMNIVDIVGVAAYNMAFALIESMLYFGVLFGVLFLFALILPKKLLGEHFGTLGGILAILFAGIMAYTQLDYARVFSLTPRRALFALGLVVLGFIAAYLMTLFLPWFERISKSILQRLSILSMIYSILGVLGILIIIVRNIFG
jgi:hypothetical protein